ncbi:unnamed protein product [Adineta steineri]|uniref:Uncharacterized protein n=1 Tax=Adineta steineri TaxID=433720 RepID=A0A814LHD4_9BILA|nr:unnamed protein product [Adineta steineri]
MPSSLIIPRWYTTTTKITPLYNSLAQQSKEISLQNSKRRYRGTLPTAIITTVILFLIKLPSYYERYSR